MKRKTIVAALILAGLAAAAAGWQLAGPRHHAEAKEDTASRAGRASVLASFAGSDATRAQAGKPLPALVVQALHLEPSTAEDLGAVRLSSGPTHRLVLARKRNGDSCLLDVGPANVGTGCGRDLFLGRSIVWTEGFDGGPSTETMSGYHVVGLAKPDVRTIEVTYSDGSRANVPIQPNASFYFEAAPGKLAAGIRPARISSYGPNGQALDRMDL